MAQEHHTLLKIGGAAAAAFAAYEFLYKPWKANQDALLATAQNPGFGPFTNTSAGGNVGLPYITFPGTVGPQPSNLDPGAAVGGPIGYCMHKKGWTQTQCTQRYDAMVQAYQNASAALAQLQSGQAAAATQAQIAATQAAIQASAVAENAAIASGNTALADQYKAKIVELNADLVSLQGVLAKVPSEITSYQHDMAGLNSDFISLFGSPIAGEPLI